MTQMLYNVIVTKFDKDEPYTIADEVYESAREAENYAWKVEKTLSPCSIEMTPCTSPWTSSE